MYLFELHFMFINLNHNFLETKTTVELYEEIWSDISPGKEQGIRMNLKQICACLKETINSPSWSMKTQVQIVELNNKVNFAYFIS